MKLKNGLSFEYHQYGVLGTRFDDKINDVGVRAASWQFQVMFRSRAAGYLDKCWAWGKSEMIAKGKNTATHFLNSIGWLYSILDHLRGDHAWLVEPLQPQNSKRDVTGALYIGGAGIAIIGGLYWKKGTTVGAWAGLLSGSGLVTGGIIARQIWGEAFPLNGAQISFIGSLSACLVYAIVSLLTYREDFNSERMLHRGVYAMEEEKKFETKSKTRVTWGKLIGLDEHFTFGDKLLAGGLFGWSILWLVVFVVGTIWNLIAPWPISVWSQFWFFVGIGVPLFFAFATAIWFTWGGIRDMRVFFKRIKEERVDPLDNGMMVNHHNINDPNSGDNP